MRGPVSLDRAVTMTVAPACAQELAPHGVTALGLSPGFVRTERAIDIGHADRATESPLYAGRALAALAYGDDAVARLDLAGLRCGAARHDLADRHRLNLPWIGVQ